MKNIIVCLILVSFFLLLGCQKDGALEQEQVYVNSIAEKLPEELKSWANIFDGEGAVSYTHLTLPTTPYV